ncbi:MAG: universal stress protein [Fuerstiella sp.]|nr:universal stress protein [Fuerstiella sp.]MCP4856355.1 universal stress protein [Fuerstiella sp.]
MPLSTSRIVVPIDFSGESPHAIENAVKIAGDASKLHLVHVLLPLDSVSPGVLLGDISDESRREKVTRKLTELAAEHGVSDATVTVLLGTPGLVIADYAKDQKADLIIVPSHGYHGFKRMFLGSVAERVIRHAECSVLVLRRSDAE